MSLLLSITAVNLLTKDVCDINKNMLSFGKLEQIEYRKVGYFEPSELLFITTLIDKVFSGHV